ncbi:hypothetical protein JTB14_015471 [Gonioctena quinquepunctata]|nr:hypothetical protein JTB14_015471 [Gonioctena quinquepunctata]
MEVKIELPENRHCTNLCRACLCSNSELRSLLDSTELLLTFKSITYLQIEEFDMLPRNICMNCTVKLEDISQFIDKCKASDAYLRKELIEKDNEVCDAFDIFDENEEEVTATENYLYWHCSQKKILSGLQRHMRIHLGIKPFKCKTCGKTFAQKATLERHYLTHTGETPFECDLCGKVGRRKDQLIEHIQRHHTNVTDFDSVISERLSTDINSLKVEPETKEQLITKSNTPDSENNQTEEEVKFKTKKRIEICLCNLCGKVFQRRGYLKNHMAIHAKVKPFICNVCGRGFTQRHSLTRHNLVHTKERPFQCNLCGKTFTRKEILTEHIKNHDGATPYLCFHCGKSKRSTDDKKCVCPHCGKQLHSISYLKTHLLMHSGEKPYECNICGNKFTVQRSLKHHLNIHKGIKPYQCTQCDKSFRTSSSLRKHGLLHTGERPYKCTSCDKGFIRRSHLKRHFRTH